jgi:hypothetical protein
MKNGHFLIRQIFVLSALLLASAPAIAKDWGVSLRECKSVADCIMIDMNCGRPGAVNRTYKNYSEAPDGCDKSLNYKDQAKNFDLACLSKKCVLVPKKK